MRFLIILLLISPAAYADIIGTGSNQFNLEFVQIGDAGNAADSQGFPGNAGSVDYEYRISKYEIRREWVTRANAEGNLGITMTDNTSLGGNGGNQPAAGVSVFEAATFVNWLNTSQGYEAAYTWTDETVPLTNRNTNAFYFLPNDDEWYKAAYYDTTSGEYYQFQTGSNTAPLPVASGSNPNTAVYLDQLGLAPVDFAGGENQNGVVGLGGNIYEWTEGGQNGYQYLRGGKWNDLPETISRDTRYVAEPFFQFNDLGFRVAARAVPEPSSGIVMLAFSSVLFVRRRL